MVANHAERFLTAYNRIEKYLKVQVHDKRELGFSRMVRMLSKSNAVLKQYQDDLLEFAQLRNAIVHNRVDTTYVIAEPHLSIVEQIERIERALTKPKQVIPFSQKRLFNFNRMIRLLLHWSKLKETVFLRSRFTMVYVLSVFYRKRELLIGWQKI
ncbi:hypothetical protein [Paracerasibacillus soli]|uniref:Apea-like HEPN domain-containing protein n=1 Tax=Paracerasibacillus soli TaxID=480284 RepID=A0ABU5CQI2_9BACI|nr:hypothetical protein [Virgibacillus soli]MDY0407725.1 hypothetical protein [Virgibacillus soli]